jgi:hypothetical protein
MKGFGVLTGMVMVMALGAWGGVAARVVDTGLGKRDALEGDCGKGHFGGIFKSTFLDPLDPLCPCFGILSSLNSRELAALS